MGGTREGKHGTNKTRLHNLIKRTQRPRRGTQFPCDSTDEKPDGTQSSFKMNERAANDFVAASEIGLSSDTNPWTYLLANESRLGLQNTRHDCDDHLRYSWTPANSSLHIHRQFHTNQAGYGRNLVGRLTTGLHGLGRWTTCTFSGKDTAN
jgi:hypothetical protein